MVICIFFIYRGAKHLFYFESTTWQLNQIRNEVGSISRTIHSLKLDIDRALIILERIENREN